MNTGIFKKKLNTIFYIFVFNILAACILVFYVCRPLSNSTDTFSRPTNYDKVRIGCVLISPFTEAAEENFNPHNKERVFLVNKKTKKVVRSWRLDFPAMYSKIDKSGNLWSITKYMWDRNSPVEILKLNNKSQIVKTIKNTNLHLDFDLSDHNSIFVGRYNYHSHPEISPREKLKIHYIQEIDIDTDKVLWEFDFKSHLDKSLQSQLNLQQKRSLDLTHVNSIRYLSTNPINGKAAVLIIARNMSRVFLIDYDSKNILWTSKEGILEFPHDARLLENGDLLVFNNRRLSAYTTVEQISLNSQSSVWNYRSETDNEFHSAIFGSAQRLINANTLITNGASGHIFEIDPEKQVVWEYLTLFEVRRPSSAWPFASLFRVDHYEPEFIKELNWGDICS